MKFSISISLERFDPKHGHARCPGACARARADRRGGRIRDRLDAGAPHHRTHDRPQSIPGPGAVGGSHEDHPARHGRGRGALLASDPRCRRGGARRRDEQRAARVRHRPRRLPVRIRPHGGRHAAGARRRLHEGDAAGGERAVGRETTSTTANTGRFRSATSVPQSAAEAVSADLGCGARSRNLRLGDQERRPHHEHALVAPDRGGGDPRRELRGGRSGQPAASGARVS